MISMSGSTAPQVDHILVVAKDSESRDLLISTLMMAGGYRITQASSFEEGLNMLLAHQFSLALVDVQLPDLSGIDLLTVVNSLRNQVPVILVDDQVSAKSAIAAFRLGAIDYVAKPINLDFVLMRIDRELRLARKAPLAVLHKSDPIADSPAAEINQSTSQPPSTALIIRRDQFEAINSILTDLFVQLKAQFVGLVDSRQNLIGAAGRLENADLILLTKAISLDTSASKPLLDLVGETNFHTTHFAGEKNGVYIIEFGQQRNVSMIVICTVDVKLGMVWHYTKRAALSVMDILNNRSGDAEPSAAVNTNGNASA